MLDLLKKFLSALLFATLCTAVAAEKIKLPPVVEMQTAPDQSTARAASEEFIYAFLLQNADFMWQLLPIQQQSKLMGDQRTSSQIVERMQQEMLRDPHVRTARQLGKLLNDPDLTEELINSLAQSPDVWFFMHGKYFLNPPTAYALMCSKLSVIAPLPLLDQSTPEATAAAFIHAVATMDHLTIWMLASPASRQEAVKRCGSIRMASDTLKQKLAEKSQSSQMREVRRANKDKVLKHLAIQFIISKPGAMVKLDGKYYIDYLAFL